MKKLALLSFALVGVFALSGCEKKVKTTEYFKNHPEEIKTTIAKCDKAEKLSESDKQECANAKKANITETIKEILP